MIRPFINSEFETVKYTIKHKFSLTGETGGAHMRFVIGTMIVFYFLNFWMLPVVGQFIFPWGGVAESYLHPIYMGMILLSGLIVVCTKVILEEIKSIKKNSD